MSLTAGRTADRVRDWLDGLANPLLVKDMYQSLHNRSFLGALWLLLLGSLGAYVIIYLTAGGRTCGDTMFVVFGLCMGFVALIIVPYLTFTRLSEEVKGRTLELVQITGMSARQQVRGRLLAAVVKVALVYALMGPFAVAAFLFKDVGVGAILLTLGILFVASLSMCTVGILFGALTSIRELRSIGRFGFPFLLVVTAVWLFLAVGASSMFFGGFGHLGAALVMVGLWVLVAGLAGWFLIAASANILTFEADKSSGRTKFILLLSIAGVPAGLMVVALAFGARIPLGVVDVYTAHFSIAIAFCGALWLTGKSRVAYRTQRKLARRAPWYRVALFPFVDGPGSTAVYVVLAFLLAAVAVGVMSPTTRTGLYAPDDASYTSGMLLAHLLYLTALARGVARLLPKRFRTVKILRGALLCVIVLNVVVVVTVSAAVQWHELPPRSPITALFPLLYVSAAGGSSSTEPVDLVLPALIGCVTWGVLAIRHYERYMRGEYGDN